MCSYIDIKDVNRMANHPNFEPISVKSTLNKVRAVSMPFDWSINPYRGCQHGCSFCYARSTHAFLGLETNDSFQNEIKVKENAAEVLEKQIATLFKQHKSIGRIAIGTATDPYQPIESSAKLTRRILEVLAHFQVPTTITTRSPLIIRDTDLLCQIPEISVNISLSTLDATIINALEPATSHPKQRLKTVQTLNQEGVSCGIFLAPLLPYLGDQEPLLSEFFHAASEHLACFVMPSFLRLGSPDVKQWFFQTLSKTYPKLTSIYGSLYHNRTSLPSWYKEAKSKQISMLLKKYRLSQREMVPKSTLIYNNHSPFIQAQTEQPEQLSFNF